MSTQKKKGNIALRLLVVLIGLGLCGVGIGLILYSELGADPAGVFETGISTAAGISFGTASAIVNFAVLAVVFFIDRSYVSIASVIGIFSIGYTADFTSWLMDAAGFSSAGLPARIAFLLLGILSLAAGTSGYIRADLGVCAVDLASEIISRKRQVQYRIVRVVFDVFFVAAGFLLGGAVGAGTLAAALLTGPAIQLVRPSVSALADRLTGRKDDC